MIRLLLLAAALPLAAPLAAQTPLEWDPTSPGAAQVDSYLQQKGSAMAGIGASLENLARQYNLDPRLIVAIAGAESTFGKHVCAANNAWNWFHKGSCPPSTFTSYDEGLEHVTKFMRRSYLNKGYTTVPLIRQKYCTSGCDNWAPLVAQFQAEMPAGQTQAAPPTQPVQQPVTQPAQQPVTSPTPVAAQKSTPGRLFGLPMWAVFFAGALLAAALVMRIMKAE